MHGRAASAVSLTGVVYWWHDDISANGYHSTLLDEELAGIGIVQRNGDSKHHYSHRTVVEFYVAEFLMKQLAKQIKQSIQLHGFLLSDVLLQTDCKFIRAFLDGLLEKLCHQNSLWRLWRKTGWAAEWEKSSELRNVIEILRGDNTAAQHRAATEGNVRIVGFLMVSIKYAEHSNTLTAMLLATGGGGELLCI